MQAKWIKPLFIVAALYDIILGVAALLFLRPIYNAFNVTLPNHLGYVQWGAAVVIIFGIGFWMTAINPERNRDFIRLGILFKLAYAGVVLGHQFLGSMPMMWTPFAWIDLVFAVLFGAALAKLTPGARPEVA